MSYLIGPGAPPVAGSAEGHFMMAGYGGSGEYTGPLWPRVTHHEDGTASLAWNPEQIVRGPLVPMPDPGPDETFPRMMPGIASHPPNAIVQHRTLYVPDAAGNPVAWYLHPNAPDGIILSPDGWRGMVEGAGGGGLLAPEWAPDPDEGPPLRPHDWARGFDTIIPTTGEPGPRFDHRYGWETGEWFRDDLLIYEPTGEEYREWVPIPASERPFIGGPGCFDAQLQQFDCASWPDGTQWGPGEGPYAGRTPASPYYPYLDPGSPWYGWPVVRMPPAPYEGEVPDPCPAGYWRDPEDLFAECVPIPGELPDPDAPPDCPPGWELTAEGNCIRYEDPDPDGPDPDLPVPCVDVSTGAEGTVDPETGECIPGPPDVPGGGNGAHPGAGIGTAGALALGAGLLFLLGGDR